ncbi:lantibiotic dehydratase [uncultured Mucilaginibacter sp.]|uniref:lantibiotic dehydratase n=1 Tax=uncultured Mucilaginibacter sp. TaxID=797541 RepID=UPI0025F30B0E|nr:lantibiotic dehydratase [uncultured Mucilaginibacter sp.]
MTEYEIYNSLILRVPFHSFEEHLSSKREDLMASQYFKTSLFLANSSLFEILQRQKFSWPDLTRKEKNSIERYLNRYCYRPTPFGSFSSFTVTKWAEGEKHKLFITPNFKLHLNIDQEIIQALNEKIGKLECISKFYVLNSALYSWGKDYRFIKTSYSADKTHMFFDLESFGRNKLTTGIQDYLSDGGKHGSEIIDYIRSLTGCDAPTAGDYLAFLETAGILTTDTALNIIGQDYLDRMLSEKLGSTAFGQELRDMISDLKRVQLHELDTLLSVSERLKLLLDVKKDLHPKQFFYAGLESVVSGDLNSHYQQDIRDGLLALSLLVTSQQPAMLQEFINAFKLKYDKQKIPLLQAVDPDIGIGYGSIIQVDSQADLLRDVNFKAPKTNDRRIAWSTTHRLLLSKWAAIKNGMNHIELTNEDLISLNKDSALQSPPTISVLFRVLEEGTYLESVGGVTATALLGRFAAWSEDILMLTRFLSAQEQQANPNVIFADIGQLSDQHADNINRRPHSYDYEIPINVRSTLPKEKQLALSDLLLSVVGDQLVLESKRLNKVIVPRLSSAYNYNRNHLAVFRLLCDLQYQGVQGSYTLNLENYFPEMPSYPRVSYNKVILCLATWHLSAVEVNHLKNMKEVDAVKNFNFVKARLNLPQFVSLSNFDQQLVFDLSIEEEIKLLIDSFKRGSGAVLQEFIKPAPIVMDHTGNQVMVNQFVASLYKTQEVYPGIRADEPVPEQQFPSDFIIGSKWIYLKIYCNPAIANDLLIKKLLPFLSQIENDLLHSWFFIRYRDSAYHIRLRLQVKETEIGPVLSGLKKRLNDTVKFHLIREYQADIYRREVERYGADVMELVENFFYGSSKLVLNFIQKSRLRSFTYAYHSLAFISVMQVLETFIINIDEQITFLERMVNVFYAEFSSDKTLKVDLDIKFREIRAEIDRLLADVTFYDKLGLRSSIDLFSTNLKKISQRSAKFTAKRRTQFLADLIHMHINRIFVDRQRNHELVVYYVLYKYLQSKRAKRKIGL